MQAGWHPQSQGVVCRERAKANTEVDAKVTFCACLAHELLRMAEQSQICGCTFHSEAVPENVNLRKANSPCALSMLLTAHSGHSTFSTLLFQETTLELCWKLDNVQKKPHTCCLLQKVFCSQHAKLKATTAATGKAVNEMVVKLSCLTMGSCLQWCLLWLV